MSWLKLDDKYDEHPKVEPLSNASFRLHVKILLYCARNCTNGVVTDAKLTQLANSIPGRYGVANLVKELLDARLLDLANDGVTVHDYLDYNPSKAKVLEQRERNAKRQKRHRDKKREGDNKPESNDVSNTVTQRVSHSVSHTAPSRPVPLGMEEEDAAAGASGASGNGSAAPEGCGVCETFGAQVGFNRNTSRPCQCPLGLWRLREKQRTGRWPTGPDRPGDAQPAPKKRSGKKLDPELQAEMDALIEKFGVGLEDDEALDQEVPV